MKKYILIILALVFPRYNICNILLVIDLWCFSTWVIYLKHNLLCIWYDAGTAGIKRCTPNYRTARIYFLTFIERGSGRFFSFKVQRKYSKYYNGFTNKNSFNQERQEPGVSTQLLQCPLLTIGPFLQAFTSMEEIVFMSTPCVEI